MQYERILSTLERKFAEAGLCAVPRNPTFRRRDNGFIKLVGPAYTSSTCSACGVVHNSAFYDDLVSTLEPNSSRGWIVKLPSGGARELPRTYCSSFVRVHGDTDKEIRSLLGSGGVGDVS